MALIERDRELGQLVQLLAETATGRGDTVLIQGAPGIGKTALLAAGLVRAQELGIRSLTAVGGELEQDLPFSIVRQLFDSPLRSADPAARADLLAGAAGLAAPVFGLDGSSVAEDEASIGGVVHGLYWVCSNLAERTPLLLAVDDVHWADQASLRFVSHLARRITDLPVLLVLSGRPQPPGGSLARALSGVTSDVIDLRPLSQKAVGHLVRETMSADADDAFCRACAAASGGNPFLLAEALTSLRADRVRPVAAEAARVESLRPETIARAVLTRLARLGPEAIRLARAFAVLGPAAGPRRAARLAGLEPVRAAEIVEALVHDDIITATKPIQFVHPLVRTAVYAEGSDLVRATSHKRAAVLLHAEGEPAEQLVAHLLAAEPESDPLVVDWLRAAASSAVARGAPEVAATCLSRALAEPPATAERLPILAGLARALGMANRPSEASVAFQEAAELADDPKLVAELAMELGALMVQTGRATEALASFERGRRTIGKDFTEFLLQPHAAHAMAALIARDPPAPLIERLERMVPQLRADTDANRTIIATLSFCIAVSGDRPASESTRLAALVAAGPLPARDRWVVVNFASAALGIGDQLPAALELLDRGIEAARNLGDAAEFGYLCMLRSHTALYAGKLLDAEADARAALTLHDVDRSGESPLAVAVLVDALVERGELAEAQAILAAHNLERELSVGMLIDHFVLMARGRLRLRQNRPSEALADLRACGSALAGAGYGNPAFAHWRTEAALACLALDDLAAACDLAAEELELARRFEAPRGIGIALHTAGLSHPGPASLAYLEESVSVLEGSGATLDRARSLIDYGAALRRAGHRARAQQLLRQGLDLATRCGANPLAANAVEELVAAGARPRRATLTGPNALTASELRVARLAADGATNREIAQTLFVSRRTVEVHLTSSYRKLQIDTRHQLRAALGTSR